MPRLTLLVLFCCLAAILFLDTISWSSTRFACGADVLNESGHKIASKSVTIKIELPLPIVFWRRYGTAIFDISSSQYKSLASQVDENYRIIFSSHDDSSLDGYIYLLTEKAELRQGKIKYYLECDMMDHSSTSPDMFLITII